MKLRRIISEQHNGPSNTIDFEEIGLPDSYPRVPVPYKRNKLQDETNPLNNIIDEFNDDIHHLEYELSWDYTPGEYPTYEDPGSPDHYELTDWEVIGVNFEPLYMKNGSRRDGKSRSEPRGPLVGHSTAYGPEKHKIFDTVAVDFDELIAILHKYFGDHLDELAQEYINNW